MSRYKYITLCVKNNIIINIIIMKTILIIPFRNREKHLNYFLNNSLPRLNIVIPNLQVIIVEQTEGKRFNRGATINIGYDYYKNDDYFYITHDVDVNPINDDAVSFYERVVKDGEFLGIYSDGETLGGVVKFTGSTFNKINGFPNDYWGWGHEDKELQNRAEHFNCKIEKLIKFHEYEKKKLYFKIFEDDHIREECGKWYDSYRHFNKLSVNDQKNNINSNGLNTLKYKILKESNLKPNVKKIRVEIL